MCVLENARVRVCERARESEIDVHTCVHTYMHTRIHAYMHKCMCLYTYNTHTDIQTQEERAYTIDDVDTYLHTRTHSHTRTCIYTYIHATYVLTDIHNRSVAT